VTDAVTEWLLGHGPRIILVLVIALVLAAVMRRIFRRFERRLEQEDTEAGRDFQRSRMLASVGRGSVILAIWTFTTLLILGEFGLNLAPLIAGAGIVGVAIGFGAQSLIRDFFSGFFVLLEDQYRVGDLVEIDGVTGAVERFTLRLTSLRGEDGRLHHLPNGNIKVVSNSSAGWSRQFIDLSIAYNEDLGRVRRLILSAAEDLQADAEIGPLLLEGPEVLGVEEFAASHMTLRVGLKTSPGRGAAVVRAFRVKLKEIFDREGIVIPSWDRVKMAARPDGGDSGEE